MLVNIRGQELQLLPSVFLPRRSMACASAQQLEQLLLTERRKACPLAAEHGLRQIALGLLQGEDALLNGILDDDPVDGDLVLLADAVGAVGGLVLRGAP